MKKIRDAKGTFHAKMGSIKDRNGMDLTEAEDIKKRWQEYTETRGVPGSGIFKNYSANHYGESTWMTTKFLNRSHKREVT